MTEYIDDELLADDMLPALNTDNNTDNDDLDDETQQLYEHFRFEADQGQQPLRVDKFMCEKLPHSSRNRIQRAADSGFVHVNDRPVKSNYKVRAGDVVTLMLDRPRHDSTIEPEEMPLDIVYEDDQLMVVNKPAGLVVHPGAGNFHGTLVNAIAWHMKDVPSYDPNNPEVGLVHRIDKDTSGLLVFARTQAAQRALQTQFLKHTVKKRYEALLSGVVQQHGAAVDWQKQCISLPLRPDPYNRPLQVVDPINGKTAVSHFALGHIENGQQHISLWPLTGRTHQLRVHCAHPDGLGCPIAGDPLYGRGIAPTPSKRLCLHAAQLCFTHPVSGKPMTFNSVVPF